MDRDAVLRGHVDEHAAEPVVSDGGEQVRRDPELRAGKRRGDGVAAERDRIGGGDVFLVAGRHVVGDEGNVDIGLSDEEGLHSISVVAEGWSRPASYISTGYRRSFDKIISNGAVRLG